MISDSGDITVILQRWKSDPQSAIEALTPIVYGELRRIAAGYLNRQRGDHTLQPTALINEAYLRLVRQDSATITDRSHFYALSARMMRQILVDSARAREAAKRGYGEKVQLDNQEPAGATQSIFDILTVHEALDKLQTHNERMARAVELRYFAGLNREEIAEVLAVSLATVKRDLALGEAWLRRALTES